VAKEKVNAGVVVEVATDDVAMASMLPALNEVTVPLVAGAAQTGYPDPLTVRTFPLDPADPAASFNPAVDASSVSTPVIVPPASGRYVDDKDGMSAATRARNVGVATPPDTGPAHTVLAVCVLNAKVKAGVVVAVATDDVTILSIFPALKDVTVPPEGAGVAHAGSPETTVNTCPAVPMGRRAAVGVLSS
jgi:hypothetical protein